MWIDTMSSVEWNHVRTIGRRAQRQRTAQTIGKSVHNPTRFAECWRRRHTNDNEPHRTDRVSPTHSNCACWWMVSTATTASDHTHNSILGTTSVNQRNNNNNQSCMNNWTLENWKGARFKRSMLMSSINLKYAQCAGYISSYPRTLANVL